MNNGEKHLEDNIERLIHVSLGSSPKPGSQMKERTWQKLISQFEIEQKHTGFPDCALVVLASSLAWMAIWIMKRMFTTGLAGIVILSLEPFHVVLALNLLCLPIAAVTIIVTRRRYVE